MNAIPGIFLQPKPALVDEALIESCDSAYEAMLLCWNLRSVKYEQATAAALCEIPGPHFSNILTGKKYLPLRKINRFQEVCGNLALTQYLAKEAGLRVERESEQQAEIRRLRYQIAQMRGAA
jgi:hypothetical protein